MRKAQFLPEVAAVRGNGIRYLDVLSDSIGGTLKVWLIKKWNYLGALKAL
jgi:hypothetical protein